MENHLKLFLPLSLKELGLRKVAALFCGDSVHFFYQSLYTRLPPCDVKQWRQATEEKLKLGLPESLNKQVIDRIQDIGFEIREWKLWNHCRSLFSKAEIELPDTSKLCWSNAVGIDCRKIAEQHVLCDRLDNWRRYEIACLNCMESRIPLLWHKLSEGEKKRYEVNRWVPSLKSCWPYILEGKQSELDALWRESFRNLASFNQWAFEVSAKGKNQVAAEYFFQKLTPEEREVSLMRAAHKMTDGNILFYLLSLMTSEQQMEIVKAWPMEVLVCFLDWPRRHLLPENAALIWTFLKESNYGDLLFRIYTAFSHGNYFPKLLQEFFNHAPLDFVEKSFVVECRLFNPACLVLGKLVENEDSDSIEVMFRHADAATRVKLVSCDAVFNRFYFCILEEKWDGVEACFREAALSEDDKVTLKESFMRYLGFRVSGASSKQTFRRFFELLRKTDASGDREKKVKRQKLE